MIPARLPLHVIRISPRAAACTCGWRFSKARDLERVEGEADQHATRTNGRIVYARLSA